MKKKRARRKTINYRRVDSDQLEAAGVTLLDALIRIDGILDSPAPKQFIDGLLGVRSAITAALGQMHDGGVPTPSDPQVEVDE